MLVFIFAKRGEELSEYRISYYISNGLNLHLAPLIHRP